jgi:hypothetical protein
VSRQIVVAFRMPPAGLSPGPEGPYLTRARSMCSRGEALGGRLVAWSAAIFAMAWDTDSIEEAIELATSLREESSGPERAWTCGIAEGTLEPLAPDGQRMHLAWGPALLSAASLARVAKAGEVLVDGDLRALRSGQLALIGARSATDAGQRVRGWRLDLDRPWKHGPPGLEADASYFDEFAVDADPVVTDDASPTIDARVSSLDDTEVSLIDEAEATLPMKAQPSPASPPPSPPSSPPAFPRMASSADDAMLVDTGEIEIADFSRAEAAQLGGRSEFDEDELSTSDVLQVIEAAESMAFEAEPSTSARRKEGTLADRVRELSRHERNRDPVMAIADLRRARMRAENASPTVRCQAALALAMTLSIAGRVEDALLEALDALASAREAQDAKAMSACVALLAKLYAGAGYPDAARTLKETAEGA